MKEALGFGLVGAIWGINQWIEDLPPSIILSNKEINC